MQLLPKNSVGRKLTMAITGQAILLFLIAHLIGNFSIFGGQLNAYAAGLRSMPPLIWASRILLVSLFALHLTIGTQLYFDNRGAKPLNYVIKKNLQTTFAGRTMIWTGLLTALFLIYHILHFTIQLINPEFSAAMNHDSMGRPDVTGMVASGFQSLPISISYIVALFAVMLHLSHGIQSSFQTLGLNSEKSLPVIVMAGMAAAFIIFFGFISIPVTIFTGMLEGIK